MSMDSLHVDSIRRVSEGNAKMLKLIEAAFDDKERALVETQARVIDAQRKAIHAENEADKLRIEIDQLRVQLGQGDVSTPPEVLRLRELLRKTNEIQKPHKYDMHKPTTSRKMLLKLRRDISDRNLRSIHMRLIKRQHT